MKNRISKIKKCPFRQYLRISSIIAILLYGLVSKSIAVQSLAEARQDIRINDIMVSVHFDDTPLDRAIMQISKQVDIPFNYNASLFAPDLRTSYQGEKVRLETVLKTILPDDIGFDTFYNSIILHAKKNVDQDFSVSGTVLDGETKDVLPGVNIAVKGTSRGTISNTEGHYSLTVPSENDTLIFSFVGYATHEVPINGRKNINISLQPKTLTGQEMVVVGYSKQQKNKVTGAVDQITSKDITRQPMTNINQGLQGLSPNVNIDLQSGKPFESPTINIRGATSIGQGGNALILIDGVEGDPSLLNPDDIKSISVLKDAAAAAQYGARAAFGVIQITTKKASTGFSLNVGSRVGFKQPAVDPGFVTDGYTYASNFNRAYRNALNTTPKNINKTQPFSEEYLEELKRHHDNPDLPSTAIDNNGNYVYYASTDWYGKLYKDKLMSQEYNFSASGGNERATFLLSGRYQGQDGLFRYNSDDFGMYNLRGKGSFDLFSWLTAKNNFSYARRGYFDPLNVGEGGGIWRNLADEGHPTAPMLNPDGSITFSGAYTVGDFYYSKNGKDFTRQEVRNKTELQGDFLDDKLSVVGNFTFRNLTNNISEKRVPVPYSLAPDQTSYVGKDQNNLALTNNRNNYYAANFFGEYTDTFAQKHNIDFTVGTNYEREIYNNLYLNRNGLAYPDANNINLALGNSIETSGGYYAWDVFGIFYQLNYDYDGRYLLKLSGRYDGSSKFPEDQRYGFFPSFSAGWRITQEPFWHISENLFSELKLRASYGSLGNGNVSPYTYQQQFNIYQINRIVDGGQPQAISNPGVLPSGLTWEKVTTSDIGLDVGMLDGRLQLSGDTYIRKTTDMFTEALTPPRVFGASTPKGNYADLETKGWELKVNWSDHINNVGGKSLGYTVGFNIGDNTSKITKFNNPEKNLDDYYEGQQLGEIWGYVDEGLFQSQDEIDNHANQSEFLSPNSFNGKFRPGDIKLKDLNGDGYINNGENTVENPGDRRVVGNTTPRYRFGINVDLSWGNFSLSTFFQGVGKQDWYPSNEASFFWGQYNRPYNQLPKWQLKGGMIWTEDNPDGYLPRYTGYQGISGVLRRPQTRYLMNVAYIRLKNLQLGYDFSSSYLNSIGLGKARVYINGQNLWTYSPLQKTADNIDPETGVAGSENDVSSGSYGDGLNYPILKSVTVGISLTF